MKFLLDSAPHTIHQDDFIAGQLLTPLSNYRVGNHPFAVDNGGFSKLDVQAFLRLLEKCEEYRNQCLWVACPDVVGSARRTLELFDLWSEELFRWPLALVAQDGIEDLPIPWRECTAVFIGGSTHWKESQAAADVVKSGLAAQKHVHIGRVNTITRFRKFESLGAHTCDGSGIVRFGWMLERIRRGCTDDAAYLPGCDPVCSDESEVFSDG